MNLCFQLEISYSVYLLLITFQRQTCLVTAVGTGSSFAGNIVPIMIFLTVLFFTKMPCFVKKKMIKDIYTASERERALCHLATHLLLVQYNTSFCCSVFRLLYFTLVSCTYSSPLYSFVTMSARMYLNFLTVAFLSLLLTLTFFLVTIFYASFYQSVRQFICLPSYVFSHFLYEAFSRIHICFPFITVCRSFFFSEVYYHI